MSWRPKDWLRYVREQDLKRLTENRPDTSAVEVGADAMLEALKKEGVFTYGNHTPDIDLNDAPDTSGYWCFIPDEEAKVERD